MLEHNSVYRKSQFPVDFLILVPALVIISTVKLSWLLSLLWAATVAAAPPSRVVLVRDAGALSGGELSAKRVHAMLIEAMKSLTGQLDESSAWRQLVNSNDVVGLKISTLAAPRHVTHQGVIEAILTGLHLAGVARTNIIVFDRDPQKLVEADYRSSQFHPVAIIGDTGWAPELFWENNLVGKLIWGDLEFGKHESLGTRSHLPKLLSRPITKLVNVPVLMDHETAGIANSLFNLSLGMADNVRRFLASGRSTDAAVASLCTHPAIRGKLVLTISDALIAGYAGGPSFKPQYSWPHAGLYVSRDPVAIDAVCLPLLEGKRREAGLTPIGDRAGHVVAAGAAGLGQSDRTKIELIELGR